MSTNGLTEAINNVLAKKYKRVEEKPYHEWINENKDTILEQPVKLRAEFVFEKINKDLQLNLKYDAVYQLLYRNNLLNHDVYKVNPDYYLKQLIEQLTQLNSSKKTKQCLDMLMELYAKQGPAPKVKRGRTAHGSKTAVPTEETSN